MWVTHVNDLKLGVVGMAVGALLAMLVTEQLAASKWKPRHSTGMPAQQVVTSAAWHISPTRRPADGADFEKETDSDVNVSHVVAAPVATAILYCA
ncbi:hypothetical protein MUBE_02290 [Mycobacterium uberis]|uniref:Uncharacterized protein n=2 Tax=Mycobacterium uberis TaxID=2162698 RepID=A0A3E1HK85_9MYCO|nr:hypothetical protein MUBE_02290 [Mycobacterium uberis]